MDIEMGPGIYPGQEEVIAVPSHADGAFIVDHGPYYGVRVYDKIDLLVSDELRTRVLGGDKAGVLALFEPHADRPGFFTIAGAVGHVTVTIVGSSKTLYSPVSGFLEVMPVQPAG